MVRLGVCVQKSSGSEEETVSGPNVSLSPAEARTEKPLQWWASPSQTNSARALPGAPWRMVMRTEDVEISSSRPVGSTGPRHIARHWVVTTTRRCEACVLGAKQG